MIQNLKSAVGQSFNSITELILVKEVLSAIFTTATAAIIAKISSRSSSKSSHSSDSSPINDERGRQVILQAAKEVRRGMECAAVLVMVGLILSSFLSGTKPWFLQIATL